MEYTYDELMHQVGRDKELVAETMYSHALENKVVIQRNGNQLSFTVINIINSKVLYAFHDVLPEDYV